MRARVRARVRVTCAGSGTLDCSAIASEAMATVSVYAVEAPLAKTPTMYRVSTR